MLWALELGPHHSGKDGGEIRPAVPPSRQLPAVVGHLLPQLRGARWPWLPPHLRLSMKPREASSPGAWSKLWPSTCPYLLLCWGGGVRGTGQEDREEGQTLPSREREHISILAHLLPPPASPCLSGPRVQGSPCSSSPPHIPPRTTPRAPHRATLRWPPSCPGHCREGEVPCLDLHFPSAPGAGPHSPRAPGALHSVPSKCWPEASQGCSQQHVCAEDSICPDC